MPEAVALTISDELAGPESGTGWCRVRCLLPTRSTSMFSRTGSFEVGILQMVGLCIILFSFFFKMLVVIP